MDCRAACSGVCWTLGAGLLPLPGDQLPGPGARAVVSSTQAGRPGWGRSCKSPLPVLGAWVQTDGGGPGQTLEWLFSSFYFWYS